MTDDDDKPDALSSVAAFGQTAQGLSRNPLGIIALFIVLVYGMATLVLVVGRVPTGTPVEVLVWFMVLFPVTVFGGFLWLVATKSRYLYGPGDFTDQRNYLVAAGFAAVSGQELVPEGRVEEAAEGPALKKALPPKATLGPATVAITKALVRETTATPEDASPPLTPGPETSDRSEPEGPAVTGPDVGTKFGRIEHRKALYEKTRKLFLVHVLTPTAKPKQRYGVSLFVMRHENQDLADVRSAEFFLGKSWGNRIIQGAHSGKRIGITTSAFGPFLCTCLVTFDDGEQVMLYRYVDFEMGPMVGAGR